MARAALTLVLASASAGAAATDALATGLSSAAAAPASSALAAPSTSGAPRAVRAPARRAGVTARQARAAAARDPKVARELRDHPGARLSASRKDGRWVVDLWTAGRERRQVAQAYVDPGTGLVTESWTGFQVAWTMARGYPGAFGRSVNSPWVWITLCLLFVAPFVDPRRPLRLLHLDLLALVGFSASLAFFNAADLGLSVPLGAPLLAYLAARLGYVGLRRRPRPAPTSALLVPWPVLAVATLFLIGFRVGLNIVDGNVIDVGYSGVIGADKLAHGRQLYGAFPSDNAHGDTYGPLLYLAYVPFELIWPWQGRWDALPAAHAAAAAFDLACVALLFLIGRRLRGVALGVALAYAWCAFPFTIYTTNSGANDALPAALVLLAIWLHARPLARGASIAAAGLTKLAPLALLPLFAAHDLRRGAVARPLALFAVGAGAVALLGVAIALWRSDPATVWERTVGYQAGRDAPFSPWGFYGDGWRVVQRAIQVALVAAAALVAFLPRRDDVVGLAALAGAILALEQLATTYWFYTYLVWLAPLALIAFLGRVAPQAPLAEVSVPPAPTRAAARSPAPAVAPSSG